MIITSYMGIELGLVWDMTVSIKRKVMMAKSWSRMRSLALTRRAVLAAAIASPLTPDLSRGPVDPVLALWQDWREAHADAEAWRFKWQKLEALLFRTVGFPRVAVPLPGEASSVYVIDHEEIDDLLGDRAETAALRARLHAELTSHRERWEAAAAAVQFAGIEAQHDAADARATTVSETIFKTPAGSIAGVSAKLALIITLGQPSSCDEEFPWPHLRSVLSDIRRLAAMPEVESL